MVCETKPILLTFYWRNISSLDVLRLSSDRVVETIVRCSELSRDHHLKRLPIRIRLQSPFPAEIVLFALKLFVHLPHVRIGSAVDGSAVNVVPVELILKDRHAYICHRAEVYKIAKRIAQEAFVHEREEHPLYERHGHVYQSGDRESQQMALFAHVRICVVDGESSYGIRGCQVLESNGLQKEQHKSHLDFRTDFPQSLQFVPFVADE